MSTPAKILVVDDHVDLAENIAEILTNAGHEALVADSAEAALGVFERGAVDALITDYRLPGLSGAELIDELRARGVVIPAIVVSAYTDDDTIERSRRAGACEVLPKPVNLAQLVSVVESIAA